MRTHVTIPRRQADIKLRSARRAVYFFQRQGSTRYEREVPVDDLVRSFAGNAKSILRVRLEDSQHVVLVPNKDATVGYVVEF